MESELFENDPRDRKRRFLRGLNCILGRGDYDLEGDRLLGDAINMGDCGGILGFRKRLVETYLIGFTPDQIKQMIVDRTTVVDLTEQCVEILYRGRGDSDLNTLLNSSAVIVGGQLAIDLSEMDNAPKFGMNGYEWCDVATGPCSCGAWHK
jgi:hypothetical protein